MDVRESSVSLLNTFAVLASGGNSLGSGSKIVLSEDMVWLLGSITCTCLCCSSMDAVGTRELVL